MPGALAGLLLLAAVGVSGVVAADYDPNRFPRPLASYAAAEHEPLAQVLKQRMEIEPFNLVATMIFFLAVTHTFLAPVFMRLAHRFEHEHRQRLTRDGNPPPSGEDPDEVSFKAQMFHFLGEIEAIFGIWVVPLVLGITLSKGWPAATDYLSYHVKFTEPLFVVVIMAVASSRPILKLAEKIMGVGAALGRGSTGAWWLAILTMGPVLGSFITEPAAMTISALLLAEKLYSRKPSTTFAYATLGLLFVNISVGGTLTHFAAPPVLMVAGRWGWGISHMFLHFGWKAVAGIVAANLLYFVAFRREFQRLAAMPLNESAGGMQNERGRRPVPAWITLVHVLFLGWTVMNNHYPALFIGGFLFYLAFAEATEHHQYELRLRPALLVGFFLAGLVVHGGLQGWWIEPVLRKLNELPLFFGAAVLTAFNDNAAITYLASLVPGFGAEMKYAVVAGAVAGGGLTVIANAPNPAGQSILSRFFKNEVSPLKLLLGALFPTVIMAAMFLLFR